MHRHGDLLARYKSGDCVSVWREIGSQVNLEGDYLAEARDVADETMKRVARNSDLVAERLAAAGWRALSGDLRSSPIQMILRS
jgi:hypothetical protein